ncbi:MAG: hypothetical protein HC915_20155, partial [Anaerolineae bacterium]|nr:hypothetical protein [Anaerolineae bacterium]
DLLTTDAEDAFALSSGPVSSRADLELASLDSLRFEEDEALFGNLPPFEEDLFPASAQPADLPLAAAELPEAGLDLARSEDLPAWLQNIRSAEATVPLVVLGVESRFEQVPEVVLPPELRQLRARSQQVLQRSTPQVAPPGTGPLTGIEGALAAIGGVLKIGELRSQRQVGLDDAQRTRVNALQRVLEVSEAEGTAERIDLGFDLGLPTPEAEAQPTPGPAPRPKRARRRLDRLVITLVLLVAVLLPFASADLHLGDDPGNTLPTEALPLAQSVARLDATRAQEPPLVLVAFEYAPTAAQELDPLAEAVCGMCWCRVGGPWR